jgi:PKD repeat protein
VSRPEPKFRLPVCLPIARRAWLRAAALGVTWLGLLFGAAPASAGNLLYYGGPVVHSPNLVLVQWGPHVRSTYASSSTGDPAFFRYLVTQDGSTSDIGGVLAQYMDTTGSNSQNRFSFAGSFQINPSVGANPPARVGDSAIQSELASDIGSGALPAPSGNGLDTVYVVLFPAHDNVCLYGNCAYDSSAGFCAYHGSFQLSGSSTQVLYAAIPDDGPGTPNYGYCGEASNDLDNQTAVVSHELAEAINDPLVDEAPNWAPPLGWYDRASDSEVADKCDAQPLVANGPWTVEPVWSNLDGNCEGGEPAFAAPTASFLAASSGEAGRPLGFDASGSSDPPRNHIAALEQGVGSTFSVASGITSYDWNWGDHSPAISSSSATANHTYSAAGTYQVSLTVTDSLGFTSTVTRQVSVSAASSSSPAATTGGPTAVDSQDATLNGTVNSENQSVSYQFAYGTDPGNLSETTPLTAGPAGETATPVSATLSGLAPTTTYYYQLQVLASGQTFTGAVQSLVTGSALGASQAPVIATGGATLVSAAGALLTGTINPDGSDGVTYRFVYGTSPTHLDRSTRPSAEPAGTTATPVAVPLTGLTPMTRYYFRLCASNSGEVYCGPVQTFNTATPTPGVITGAVSRAGSQTARISGSVDPKRAATKYLVEFGTTTRYGYSTAATHVGSGSRTVPVSVVLGGLKPRTTYHYRFVATSAGGTAVGADRRFTTGRAVSPPPGFSFTAPRRVAAHRLLSHRLRVRFRCSRGCTAHFLLTVAPAGLSQARAVPIALARATAKLHRRGSETVRLWFIHAGRRRARHLRGGRRVKLVLTGYAVAPRSKPSRPELIRIRLT